MGTTVQCAGCRRVLNVPPGLYEFSCPECQLLQALPPQLRNPPQGPLSSLGVRGIDHTKIQLPCANCRAVLNVPPGLHRFQCPQCKADLAVDPTKLAGYMNTLRHLTQGPPDPTAGNSAEALKRKLDKLGEALTDGSIVKRLQPGLIPQEEINEVALEVEAEEEEEGEAGETFTDYRPSKMSIGPPHPDPVVETASLSAVEPPEPKYQLAIADEVVQSEALSCLQLETILYACQRHEQFLADRSRAGFFMGDGAGVGKGRTIAGLVLENWRHNRRKALWVSIGADLKFDARRDLDDVGCDQAEVHALNKLPYGKLDSKAVGIKEGVVFLTYSSLIAASEKGRSRLQQLVQWCGPGFDGLVVFDECHKAKNLVPEGGGQATRTGEAVLELQAKLPGARVVYCSATGASEPRNLGYMTRLGLWGSGTDFPDFAAFLGALEKRGVGALELIAMDMKARGMYVCRTLSFKGAEFEVVQVDLGQAMNEVYTQAAQFWCELRVDMMDALRSVPPPTDAYKKSQQNALWRFFWATHQRFFRYLCMAAKVPAAVRMAKTALAEGKCAVIGLQSTGEARTEEAVTKYGLELEDFVSGPRELLLKLVEDQYPLPPVPHQKQDTANGKKPAARAKGAERSAASVSSRGRVRKAVRYHGFDDDEMDEDYKVESEPEEVEDADMEFNLCCVCTTEDDESSLLGCKPCGRAVHPGCLSPPLEERAEGDYVCQDCGAATQEIREEREAYSKELWRRYQLAKERKEHVLEGIRKLSLPNNPLDDLIDQLGGPEAVAEMTGRRGMLVRAANGKGVQYQPRNSKEVSQEMTNMHEKQQFMDGRKLVAILSEAASAGISLQADRRAQNQRRRVHLTLELPWSADKAIQQFGRTHRSNQTSAPQYRLLFTNLGGERRFASIVAKRLETLGALTQGDRRAGPSLSAYNYDSVWGKKALATMYKAIMEQARPLVAPSLVKPGTHERAFYSMARAALVASGLVKDALPSPHGNAHEGPFLRPSGRIGDSDMHDVGRFLNRALGLEPEEQNNLFDFFVAQFDAYVRSARKDGNFDAGIVDIRAPRIELRGGPKVVHVDPMSGAPTTHSVVEIDRGMAWEEASQVLEAAEGEDREGPGKGQSGSSGFYQSKREWLGRRHYLLAIERPSTSPSTFRVFRPASGLAVREMPAPELHGKYVRVASLEQAQAGWAEDFRQSGEQCMHGPKCKVGAGCTVGRRIQQVQLLSGLIFPVWGTVDQALSKQERLTHRRLRVVRLETSADAKRIVGIHVPNPAIGLVLAGLERLRLLEQQHSKPEAQSQQVQRDPLVVPVLSAPVMPPDKS